MRFIDWQQAQCPVCSHELHADEAEVLENNGRWCLVETSCNQCGSSTLGLLIGRGRKTKHVRLLSDIPPKDDHGHEHGDFDKESVKPQEWAES